MSDMHNPEHGERKNSTLHMNNNQSLKSYDQSVGGLIILAAIPTKLVLLKRSMKEKLPSPLSQEGETLCNRVLSIK